MSASSRTWPDLPEEVRYTLRTYLGQLRKQIGEHLETVILYGSLVRGDYVQGRSNINLFLMIRQFSLDIGQRCGSLHRRWGKEGVVAPLIMNQKELLTASELFPLEIFEIKDSHVLLEGRDPFPELHLTSPNLMVQCQQELIGNLFRLRQRFVEGEGKAEAIFALLPISLTALMPCLRGLFRLLDQSPNGTSAAILERLPLILQVEPIVFHEVLDVKRGLSSPGKKEFPRLYERYVQGLEGLIRRVNELKAEGRL
jgi:predicted nucleotidyltransferase